LKEEHGQLGEQSQWRKKVLPKSSNHSQEECLAHPLPRNQSAGTVTHTHIQPSSFFTKKDGSSLAPKSKDDQADPKAAPLPPPLKKQKIETTVLKEKSPQKSPPSDTTLSYDSLCKVFADIEATTKRLKITSLLMDYFVQCIRYAYTCLFP
jgi:hypothetical protein